MSAMSHYRVFRWYPHMANGECINVGVIAYNETEVCIRVLKDWTRFEAFAGPSAGLRDILDGHQLAVLDGRFDVAMAKAFESHYMSSLILSTPYAALLPPQDAIEVLGPIVLVERSDPR